jgi:hypothetical protein
MNERNLSPDVDRLKGPYRNHLLPDDRLITVQRDQLASVLPELATNSRIRTLLFMLNNPTGSATRIARRTSIAHYLLVRWAW